MPEKTVSQPAAERLSLAASLCHQPQQLRFGTSGRRGLVVDLTQLEIYINARAELEYLQTIPLSEGGIVRGDEFYFAYDLRPSSTRFDPESQGRGEIAQAIECAIRDAGMRPVNLGYLPTPALSYYAIRRNKGSMMVTGSHIPFDRNGYKSNTSRGELLKHHEEPIAAMVNAIREEICSQPLEHSLFNQQGMLKSGHRELPPVLDGARQSYVERYVSFWPDAPLRGLRLLFYQHSAVGRDLVPEILERLGAEVIRTGHCEDFVPIDTENIDEAQISAIESLTAKAPHGAIDAVISTDGDSDRPLVLTVDPVTARLRFQSGDLLGMLVAEYLHADAVVVPITCNDAIDRGNLAPVLEPKTRVGSPHVVAGMEIAKSQGKKVVCGWEANGGFLLGSDVTRDGRLLRALATRDAVLPVVAVLACAQEKNVSLPALFSRLPRRFNRTALMKNFPRATGTRIVRSFQPAEPTQVAAFERDKIAPNGLKIPSPDATSPGNLHDRLSVHFSPQRGFSAISQLNFVDGLRVTFCNGEVTHLRPSGNADEFRVYAFADSAERADEITAICLQEPNGILREMERAVS